MLRPLACLALAAGLVAADGIFDSCQALTPAWVFLNGGEYPGATGTLTTAKAPASGLTMTWDFSGGGNYVAAVWKGSALADSGGVSLAVMADAPCSVAVRLRDENGRTFQGDYLNLVAGANAITRDWAGTWKHAWGGVPGTGPKPGRPESIALVVDKRPPTTTTGSLTIKWLGSRSAATAP
jgi:hypothetical protein